MTQAVKKTAAKKVAPTAEFKPQELVAVLEAVAGEINKGNIDFPKELIAKVNGLVKSIDKGTTDLYDKSDRIQRIAECLDVINQDLHDLAGAMSPSSASARTGRVRQGRGY